MINTSEILTEAGQVWLAELANKFQQYDLNATGKTLAGMKFTVNGNVLTITSDRAFPYTLQDGRGPAKSGSDSGGAFLTALEEWAKAKGIDIPIWAIKKKINKEGTRLHRGDDPRFKKPTDVISAPTDKALELIRSKAINIVAVEVVGRIKRKFQEV
jgi:hypothetical protein